MTRINDGGPAFPMLGNIAHNSDWTTESGMSLRDYFAAHAPWPPRWGFFVTGLGKKPEPFWVDRSFRHTQEPDNAIEIAAWQATYAMKQAIQWPWVWADAMLAEKHRTTPPVSDTESELAQQDREL